MSLGTQMIFPNLSQEATKHIPEPVLEGMTIHKSCNITDPHTLQMVATVGRGRLQ
jgi:hypothetical protein